jgi:hypothetical protein
MFRVLQLLFFRGSAWNAIAEENRGVVATLFLTVAPLLAIVCAVEGYSLTTSGVNGVTEGPLVVFSRALAFRYELVQFLMGFVMVFGASFFIGWICQSFHFYPPYLPQFTIAAYGLSPIFGARLLNCVPGMNIWMSWSFGIIGCVLIIYQGVAIVLKPDQTKGLGLYIMTAVVFTLLSAMDHLVGLMILQGKISLPF